jgi:hypothetical protein
MIVALISSSPAFAEREKLLPENLLSDLDEKLKLADQELAELKPAVEKKSQELRDLIDKKVDEGFLELEALSKELNQKIQGLEQDLDTVLSDPQIQELKEFLATLDEQTITTMIDEIIAKLAARLGVTSEQLAQFETILRDELNKQGELLSRFLDQGAQAFDEFQQENDQLWQEIGNRLDEILTSDQMQEARKWKQEVEEKINTLFQEKK